MEITKTFGNTFGNMMRAKLRRFKRRSALRYALGVALITYGIHGQDASIEPMQMVRNGIVYFVVLCVGVLLVYVITAMFQSRKVEVRTVTFTKNNIVVAYQGETVSRGWDWVIAAEDSRRVITLLIQRLPQLELFLPKDKLSEVEYRTLCKWLVARGKLESTSGVT